MRLVETFLDSDERIVHEAELRAITLGVTAEGEHVTVGLLVDEGHRQIEISWRRDELATLLMRAKVDGRPK